ncbi:MAG: DoxX family protein [Pirellulales bacterium]
MAPNPLTWLAPIGRVLLALIFIMSAAGKLQDWQGTVQMMADRGLPAPDMLLSVAVGLELVGGALVVVGLYARWGALALLLFLVPVSVIMHNFWALPEDQARGQMINFMKNVSIAGGLVFLMAMGAGPLSIDALRERRFSKPSRTSGLPSSVGSIGPGDFNH